MFLEETNTIKNITLYCKVEPSLNCFVICNQDGKVVWSESFSASPIEPSACDIEAAKKAVYLAKKIREKHNLSSIYLTLIVGSNWLSLSDNKDYYDELAWKLLHLAEKYNVVLSVEHIPRKESPVDEYTVDRVYVDYKDNIDQIVCQ